MDHVHNLFVDYITQWHFSHHPKILLQGIVQLILHLLQACVLYIYDEGNIENAFKMSPQNEILPVRNRPTASPPPASMRPPPQSAMTSDLESTINGKF